MMPETGALLTLMLHIISIQWLTFTLYQLSESGNMKYREYLKVYELLLCKNALMCITNYAWPSLVPHYRYWQCS